MARLSFAPAALRDMEEIAGYISADNPAAARRLVAELRERCTMLMETPRAGRLRPEVMPGLRSLPFRRYVVFYTVQGNEVRIERILHGARDIEALLGDN